jgi:hypothetical protein
MAVPRSSHSDSIEVRRSKVHGLGIFATRKIRKGTRLIEYLGERVSHDEADRRYEEKDANDSHTFLFIVDSKTVIDAGVDGNDARFFNHSCDPNCESVVESRRVFIEAIRTVEPGTELTYDYQIQRDDDDPDNVDEVFACRCGFPQCRGTMLWPTERKPKTARKTKAGKKGKTAAKKKQAAGKRAAAGGKVAAGGKSVAVGKSAARKKPDTSKLRAGKSAAGGQSVAAKKAGRRR